MSDKDLNHEVRPERKENPSELAFLVILAIGLATHLDQQLDFEKALRGLHLHLDNRSRKL